MLYHELVEAIKNSAPDTGWNKLKIQIVHEGKRSNVRVNNQGLHSVDGSNLGYALNGQMFVYLIRTILAPEKMVTVNYEKVNNITIDATSEKITLNVS